MTKVSIIIPLYNNEDYVAQTIDSCLSQTHHNIEIIVVENGSTDQGYQVVKSIDDKRLSVFQIPTPNAAAARNYGYHKATGTYIIFLDADDVMASNKIELQIKALSAKPKGWIASCAWAKFKTNTKEAIIKPQKVWNIQNPIDWCLQSWMGEGMMALGGWLIPKAVIEKAGHWNENLSLHDDGEFMFRVLLASQGNVFVENTVLYYRQLAISLSRHNQSYRAAKSALEVCESYRKSLLPLYDGPKERQALAYNYKLFMYEFHPKHKDLLQQARQSIQTLDVKNLPLIGGENFKKLTKIVGFHNTLTLRQIIKSVTNQLR
jgi:glycosyltransferase involved in cell wall biosynthesis